MVIIDENRMLRDAILFRSPSLEVREKCLDKGDAVTHEKVISIGEIYESSQEGLRVIG